jgi:hypothetical protein
MGMKKSSALGLIHFAMAMSATTDDSFAITERGNVGSGKQPKLPEPIKYTPFKNQEGVLKMIEDYNLIRQGKSKKGIVKQYRIKKRVDEWLKSGMLNETDLNYL